MPQMTAETLVERMKRIPEFILSRIAEILDSYDKESTIVVLPVDINSVGDGAKKRSRVRH